MPIHYKFTTKAGGDISLAEIDRLICSDVGKQVSDDTFSEDFQAITDIGDLVYKDGTWNEDIFIGLFKNVKAEFSEEFSVIACKYLNGDYIYICWYSARM